MLSYRIYALADDVISSAAKAGKMITVAESCTGGLIGGALTSVPGSSEAFDCGFVTYSYEAKSKMLGVSAKDLEEYGAVSPEIARAMADGALTHSNADIAVSVTGIAGPGGGMPGKPVGMVCFGSASKTAKTKTEIRHFPEGSREFVRSRATETALMLLSQLI
ncbi:MAG: CinA family protein [Marinicaulis sp.]|nr:CinA family protein [Marinicaulis sp.]NNE42211.1 CinA family protein [Marinicaulis sp.]NNL89107.1 CinA family protein [Marinicaulis sp.]